MESGNGTGMAGLWQEMRQRWQGASPAPVLPPPAWRAAEELPSLGEFLARLPCRAIPLPECLPCG